jgi:hypothetical protein
VTQIKRNLWDRLKDLAGRGFGCTVHQVSTAALIFAKTRSVKHPVGKRISGKDWINTS